MKKALSGLLSLSLAAMLTCAAAGAVLETSRPLTSTVSHPISDQLGEEIIGRGALTQFFEGVACGAGIVAIAAGSLSGVGVPIAIVAVASTAAACSGALGL